jgi:hypothetical protein
MSKKQNEARNYLERYASERRVKVASIDFLNELKGVARVYAIPIPMGKDEIGYKVKVEAFEVIIDKQKTIRVEAQE